MAGQVLARAGTRAPTRFKPYMLVFYAFLLLGVVIVLVPIWWMVSTSFDKLNSLAMPMPPRFWPARPSWFNYELVLNNMDMGRYLKNTGIVVAMDAVLQVFTASLAGFVFSKGRFPGKPFALILIMSNMMIPFETRLMPVYQFIRFLGLNNSYLGIVLPGVMTNAFNIFMIKKFCDDLPYELLESGVVDGASKFRIYWSIFLPLMSPILATLVVLTVMNSWNDLLWPLIVANNPKMYTVQVGLSIATNNSADPASKHAGMATAASVLSILPLAVVFVFMQRYIVQSVAATGIKQ